MSNVQAVFDDIRALLQGGSTSPARGLGNGVLQYAFSHAYTEMWQTMEQVSVPRVRREFYFLVPAYTSVVDPVTARVFDLGEPEAMWERSALTSVQIATTDTSSPIAAATVVPHNLTTNTEVTIGQVDGTRAPWGRYFVTVVDPSTFTLNGSVSDGVAGIGGTVTTSSENFAQRPVRWVDQLASAPQSRLRACKWESGLLNFSGATQGTQIKVTYFADATPPSDALAILGVPGASTFLATRAAGIVAQSRGLYQMADTLEIRALGPGRQADGRGGQLRGFLNIMVNGMQREQYRQPGYSADCSPFLWGNTAFGGGAAFGAETWNGAGSDTWNTV